eukprot:127968_1
MRAFIGRRTLKYIGLPAIVSAGLVWKGRDHYKSARSWPTNDVLLNVQVIHRHGDRLPITLLRNDNEKEDALWAKKVKQNTADTDEPFQWKHVSAKLNGTYMVHKKDNYDMESAYLVSSKDNDPQTHDILSNMHCWDRKYIQRENGRAWCGQLTDKGVQCMITLGTWLRERYVQQLAFLPPTYQNMTNPHISIPPRKSKPKQETPSVYYISTNFQRCIHSADALLQGLYPLQNRSEDSSIPIHCDVANTWLYPNPCIKQKLCTFYDIGIDRLEYVSSRMCKLHCLDRVSMRLSVGSLLNKLYQNMKHLETKFVVYSARDGTLQRLLVALANGNDFTFPWPSYSASLIFEVWEKNIIEEGDKDSFVMTIKDWMNGVDRSRAKYVRILYEGHVLHLNGDEFTPIDGFQQMWKDLMVNEDTYWDRECVC